MFKIRDWLYISDYPSASSPDMVKSVGIGAMLQLFEPFTMEGVETQFLKVEDGHPITPEQIKIGGSFLRQQHAKGRKVLATCGAGISRSVTFSIIALKEIEGLSLIDAYREIRQHHPQAMPDHLHWKSIADYYHEEGDFWKIWGDIMLGEDE